MAGWNSTASFSRDLRDCGNYGNNSCDAHLLELLHKRIGEKLMLVNALLVASAILAGVIVGIGAYGQRYRHRRLTRFIYLGATTLFLPIISYVVSIGTDTRDYIMSSDSGRSSFLMAKCDQEQSIEVVIWAFLVQIIMINTSVIVATDDREGQNIGPPFELLVQGVWTLYLGILHFIDFSGVLTIHDITKDTIGILFYELVPFALICAKIMFKYYGFQKARRSFALGRNPLLISGHMQQLQQQEAILNGDVQVGHDASSPPALLVTGEEGRHVEEKPCGYVFKAGFGTTSATENTSLVTIDRIWSYGDNILPMALKDLSLSFALFKLLRCRFVRYKQLTNAGSTRTLNFFWSLLLEDGQHARVFGLIADELSFVNDYYFSSLPIFYSKCWLPILSIFISLLSMGNCIAIMKPFLGTIFQGIVKYLDPMICDIMCIQGNMACLRPRALLLGDYYFDLVPILLLTVLVMIAEVRDISSYICSNWTKVTLICHLVDRASSQHSLCMNKWVGLLLHCRCKLMNHWDGKMGQCSVLVICPRKNLLFTFIKHLLRIPDLKRKVKVPEAVKVCIIDALRCIRNGRQLSNGTSSLCQIQGGEGFVWACNGEGTTDTILVWYIATSILEVKHPYRHVQEHSSPPISYSDHKIAATHLSRYCAYLVTCYPELLPDEDAWSKSLYKAARKDAERALASHVSSRSLTPEEEYEKLVELLTANSKHEVLKNGVKLGKQLVQTFNNEETVWKLLADFWSEMILYIAPSDNIKGHLEAIARGGELITLLWALLFHAGIVSRPSEYEGTTATSAGAV